MNDSALTKSKHLYLFSAVPKNIIVAFSGRDYDAGFDQEKEKIIYNRKKILSTVDIRLEQLVCANQIHDDKVVIVTNSDRARGSVSRSDAIAYCDAMITKEKNIALGVLTADCLSVFLLDEVKNVIAIVHSGWRGTKKAILKKTVYILKEIFQVEPKNLLAYFGPAIRSCCYEVKEEFLDYFKRGVIRRDGKIFLDLIQINRLQLQECGVLNANIFDCQICTFCQNDTFFSYRKEGKNCGRQISLVMMRD